MICGLTFFYFLTFFLFEIKLDTCHRWDKVKKKKTLVDMDTEFIREYILKIGYSTRLFTFQDGIWIYIP